MTRFLLQRAALVILLISAVAPIVRAADAPITAQSNKPLAVPVTPATAAPSPSTKKITTVFASPAAAKESAPLVESPVPAQEHLPLGRSGSAVTTPRANVSLPPIAPSTGASTTPTPAPAQLASTPSPSGSWLLQTLTALALVIGLIFMLRVVMQKLFLPGGKSLSGRIVEVLARSTIGPKTQVLFLRINQRIVVVGQTPAGLNSLTTLEDPQDVAWLLEQVQASRPRSITTGFRQLLHRFDKDYETDAASETTGDAAEQSVDRTRDRLSGLITRMKDMKDRSGGDEK